MGRLSNPPEGTVSCFLGRSFKSHQTAKDSPGKPPPQPFLGCNGEPGIEAPSRPGLAGQGLQGCHGRACLPPKETPRPAQGLPGSRADPDPPEPPDGGPRRSPEAGSALLSNGGGGEGRGESALNERFPRAFPCRLPSQMILAPPPPPPPFPSPPPALLLLLLPRLHLWPTPLA